jgi:hypothetical protein
LRWPCLLTQSHFLFLSTSGKHESPPKKPKPVVRPLPHRRDNVSRYSQFLALELFYRALAAAAIRKNPLDEKKSFTLASVRELDRIEEAAA